MASDTRSPDIMKIEGSASFISREEAMMNVLSVLLTGLLIAGADPPRTDLDELQGRGSGSHGNGRARGPRRGHQGLGPRFTRETGSPCVPETGSGGGASSRWLPTASPGPSTPGTRTVHTRTRPCRGSTNSKGDTLKARLCPPWAGAAQGVHHEVGHRVSRLRLQAAKEVKLNVEFGIWNLEFGMRN